MDIKNSFNVTNGSIAVFILAVTFVLKLVIDSRQARLSQIPGPWLARYTDLYAVYLAWRTGRSSPKESIMNDLRDKYGDVVRLGPRSVTVFDPSAVPVIYGVRSRKPFRQSGVTTSLLSIQDEALHSRYRRLVSNAYSLTSLKAYEPYVDELIAKFVEICNSHIEEKKALDLNR
ncbi:hypothetical protein BDP81DRAFT_418950 [Colletotrichum phormii]|uniref:Uncharacterized protein n=1 Tax=Colletotrichum phormii TaxID=359342 RepID=A0AAJ0EM18_9PEZI|nr:uncharacterized protein BDP81DRAFT_418950 [Colletotrichum phormii]KAK1641455.1 hypothetical protein BDP81DRAFT_418950 [Colletotrichum phormii]